MLIQRTLPNWIFPYLTVRMAVKVLVTYSSDLSHNVNRSWFKGHYQTEYFHTWQCVWQWKCWWHTPGPKPSVLPATRCTAPGPSEASHSSPSLILNLTCRKGWFIYKLCWRKIATKESSNICIYLLVFSDKVIDWYSKIHKSITTSRIKSKHLISV